MACEGTCNLPHLTALMFNGTVGARLEVRAALVCTEYVSKKQSLHIEGLELPQVVLATSFVRD